MKFLAYQQIIHDLIAASPAFVATAASSVVIDLGFSRPAMEESLQDNGFCASVWVPTKGDATSTDAAESIPIDNVFVVRMEFLPGKLKEFDRQHKMASINPSAAQFVSTLIECMIKSIVGAAPSPGGVRFMPATDFYELMNLDEGLLAYHFRFVRFTVFGV
jgi:hypothetical protein